MKTTLKNNESFYSPAPLILDRPEVAGVLGALASWSAAFLALTVARISLGDTKGKRDRDAMPPPPAATSSGTATPWLSNCFARRGGQWRHDTKQVGIQLATLQLTSSTYYQNTCLKELPFYQANYKIYWNIKLIQESVYSILLFYNSRDITWVDIKTLRDVSFTF